MSCARELTYHENAHLLLGEEALEKLGERDSHRASSVRCGRESERVVTSVRGARIRIVCPGTCGFFLVRTFGFWVYIVFFIRLYEVRWHFQLTELLEIARDDDVYL